MGGQRKALIIANDEYEQGLRQLLAPAADAEALRGVLGDPQIGDFDVKIVHNALSHVIQEQIEELFTEGRPEDVLLLYFSCHGLKSESGELFFAARNTRPDRLGSTAVPAAFVQRCMAASRSRRIVLFLDCCYGGAFSRGVTVRASGDVDVFDSFPRERLGGGRGKAVITASSAMEYAFEGENLSTGGLRKPSLFTAALVQGLATGEADQDEDGLVSLNELYEYIFDKVREQNPNQTPSRQIDLQGELYLAHSQRKLIRVPSNRYDRPRRGADIETETTLSVEDAAKGVIVSLSLEIDGNRKVVSARIPAGVADNQRVPVRGQGSPGTNGGASGDLYVVVHVLPSPEFVSSVFGRRGSDLTVTVPVTFAEAALGAEIRIPAFSRDPVTLKIPSGTRNGHTFRVPGMGLSREDQTKGDLLVTVEIAVPTNLRPAGAGEATDTGVIRSGTDVNVMRSEMIARARDEDISQNRGLKREPWQSRLWRYINGPR